MGLVKRTGVTERDRIENILRKEGYSDIYVWSDPPDTHYDWHTHTFDEVRWVLEGEILIGTEEGQYLLKPGDRMEVPAGTRHWAKVGPKGVKYICASKYR